MRLDRLATLHIASPLRRLVCQNKEPRIPILMYHSISEGMQKNVHPYYEITTTPDVFDHHMQYLHENNYRVITLAQAVKILTNAQLETRNKEPETRISEPATRNSEPGTRNHVVLTFDDGYRDFYTNAFPVLEKYGFTATVFLPTGSIGDKRQVFNTRECLNWEEVCELNKKGVNFGSHTVTHPELKYLKKDEIEYELRKSKETIEAKIGEAIDSFSYPYAFPEAQDGFKEYLKEVLEHYGYKTCVSTIIGTVTEGNDQFLLKRIPVNAYDDLMLFKAKLEGGYDWMHRLQYASKQIRSRVKVL